VNVRLRAATIHDVSDLQSLIADSARGLSVGYYSDEQIEACIQEVFGVDTQLIADGSYYVVDVAGDLVAAGGWSARKTLYGGDQMKSGPDPLLNPEIDAARIRAFFVHPRWARRGLARQIYLACSDAAWAAGFRSFELMATYPGEPVYAALGFSAFERVVVRLRGEVDVPFVRMRRAIDPPLSTTVGSRLTSG
jgi:GNAT superfamily N-acetyltransferase